MIKKNMFSLYLLQINRFRRSGKLIENEGPNGIKKVQNWSRWRPRYDFLRFWWISASLSFWCFLGLPKGGPENKNKIIFLARNRAAVDRVAATWLQIIIQLGPLSAGSGNFGWFYILLSDNAWHRAVSADFGACWILKGFQNQQFSHKVKSKSQKRMSSKASWKNMSLRYTLNPKTGGLGMLKEAFRIIPLTK